MEQANTLFGQTILNRTSASDPFARRNRTIWVCLPASSTRPMHSLASAVKYLKTIKYQAKGSGCDFGTARKQRPPSRAAGTTCGRKLGRVGLATRVPQPVSVYHASTYRLSKYMEISAQETRESESKISAWATPSNKLVLRLNCAADKGSRRP